MSERTWTKMDWLSVSGNMMLAGRVPFGKDIARLDDFVDLRMYTQSGEWRRWRYCEGKTYDYLPDAPKVPYPRVLSGAIVETFATDTIGSVPEQIIPARSVLFIGWHAIPSRYAWADHNPGIGRYYIQDQRPFPAVIRRGYYNRPTVYPAIQFGLTSGEEWDAKYPPIKT